nr:hypothetical protein [uncultured Cohaesibacter sp.]
MSDWAEAENRAVRARALRRTRPAEQQQVEKEPLPGSGLYQLNQKHRLKGKEKLMHAVNRARAEELPVRAGGPIKRVMIENPYGKGEFEKVKRRVIDPIENLFARGRLDDMQHRAAHIVRQAVEGMAQSVGSIDPERIRVDCSGAGDSTVYIMEASATLKRAQQAVELEMGREGWNVVRRVAGDGETLTAVAFDFVVSAEEVSNGGLSREAKAYASRALQLGLNHVAVEFGLATSR